MWCTRPPTLCSSPWTFPTADGARTPCGNFKPCPSFNPLAPCSTNAWASATDSPSTAAAITTPANDDRDSRNSSVCIPEPAPPPNS